MKAPNEEDREKFGSELMALLGEAIEKRGGIFLTLGPNPRMNRVIRLVPEGVEIETKASDEKESGPQLVEASMFIRAWDYLRATGELSNKYLLSGKGLNVKRSSAVCAILATLPGVRVRPGRQIILEWSAPPGL